MRLDHDPLQDALVEPRRQDRLQQRACIPVAERLDAKLRNTSERADRLPRGKHDRDLLGQETPGHEREHRRRGAVEPLSVVDQTEQRLVLGGLRQEAEDGKANEERIRRPSRAQAERNLESLALGIGKVFDQA